MKYLLFCLFIYDEAKINYELMIDIYCDVIDNFWDISFAFKAMNTYSFEQKENNFRFFSNNKELFDVFSKSLLWEVQVKYYDFSEIQKFEPNTLILNFFERKIDYNYLESFEYEIRLINFSYFSLESFHSLSSPWIVQNHGSIKHSNNLTVVEFSVSLLAGTGWVFSEKKFLTNILSREYFEHTYNIPKNKKWISIFCYPETQELLEKSWFFENFWNEYLFLSFGKQNLNTQNSFQVPFLTLHEYYFLLKYCHWNMVRGENSLITALEAWKAFYWDIYKESNQAHIQKLEDFTLYLTTEKYPLNLILAQTQWNIQHDFQLLSEIFQEK